MHLTALPKAAITNQPPPQTSRPPPHIGLPSSLMWFLLDIVVVFMALGTNATLFYFTFQLNPNIDPHTAVVISLALLIFISTFYHLLRIFLVKPVPQRSLPHITCLLAGAFAAATIFHAYFIVKFIRHATHGSDALPILVCYLHSGTVDSGTRLWDFVHSPWGYESWDEDPARSTRHWILYAILVLKLAFAIGFSFTHLRFGWQVIWALPTIVLWAHFVFLLAYILRQSPARDLSRLGRQVHLKWLRVMCAVFLVATVSSVVFALGFALKWKHLPTLQFVAFQLISLWAIFPAISLRRQRAQEASKQGDCRDVEAGGSRPDDVELSSIDGNPSLNNKSSIGSGETGNAAYLSQQVPLPYSETSESFVDVNVGRLAT
ncbi:hypothetical protein LXA43DRAFT_1100352 [Ganoderma leucocontextum]|nr:hypothetical protein LXA43DRAFT_1100352 [Ganoderma leucocontextum]